MTDAPCDCHPHTVASCYLISLVTDTSCVCHDDASVLLTYVDRHWRCTYMFLAHPNNYEIRFVILQKKRENAGFRTQGGILGPSLGSLQASLGPSLGSTRNYCISWNAKRQGMPGVNLPCGDSPGARASALVPSQTACELDRINTVLTCLDISFHSLNQIPCHQLSLNKLPGTCVVIIAV